MIQYMDMTKAEGCFGVIPENGETIVFTGVSINSMPLSVKRKEGELYADFAKKYGSQQQHHRCCNWRNCLLRYEAERPVQNRRGHRLQN